MATTDYQTPSPSRPWQTSLPLANGQLLLWALLATIVMLFAGFSSAYLVRRTATDWSPVAIPGLLWVNTAVLIASSFTLEWARGRDPRGQKKTQFAWLLVTAVLGLAFLAGQLVAWSQLAARGVYLPSSPHSSFFYILTGLHGLHLVGGLIFLIVVSAAVRHRRPPTLNLCATYWHFLGGLWLFLVYLLFA